MPRRIRALFILLAGLAAVAALVHGGLARWLDPAYRLYRQGARLAHEGDEEAARRAWEGAIRSNPALPEPYYALADMRRRQGRSRAAGALLRELLAVAERANTIPRHLLCRLADVDFLSARMRSATFFAEHAVRLEPDCYRGHHVLGMLLDLKGDSQGALRHLERAHRLAPGHRELATALIRVQIANFRMEDARRTARTLLHHDPAAAEGYYWLGWTHANYQELPGDAQQAADYFARAVALDPSLSGAYGEWGRIALQLGDLEKAKELLERAWSLDPTSESVAYHLARIYSRRKDPRATGLWRSFKTLSARRERLEALHKRQRLARGDLRLTLETARLEMREGHLLEATALVESLLETDPANPEALRLRAQLSGAGR